VDLDANLRKYFDGDIDSGGRKPNERYASFDYCFNYFQGFRESGRTSDLSDSVNLHASCLHLGFYLASWGMFRGSAELLQKSARHLVPAIEIVAGADSVAWEIDADCYSKRNIEEICVLAETFFESYPGMSYTLVTKILLGVFGSVPAFDENYRRGCKSAGITASFGPKALKQVGAFYEQNAAIIESYRLPTIDFLSGESTRRLYTRAKVIDMALFMEGFLLGRRID
jgi:hypothetical protein